MNSCPPISRLQALLDAGLSATSTEAVEAHVEGCAVCQELLDKLTADPLSDRIRPTTDPVVESSLASTFLLRVQNAERSTWSLAPPEIPGYKLEGEISRGGMGVVYKATDTRLNRPAAVKMLRDARFADSEAMLRFLIEAEAVARLRHSGIVQVYEFGQADGLPFLAMEYVPGGTLAGRLKDGVAFTPHESAVAVLDLAVAVAAAHRAGVIHRDLKPANVLIADGRESGTVGRASNLCLKVADFGLARLDGGGDTVTGAVMGTPSYMSPEQASGRTREIDTRTDVYALGAILYELLSGRPPFTGDTTLDILQQVIHTDPPSFRTLGKLVPRDLEVICRKCLAKDPARRYLSADALASDLSAFRSGRAISARPVPVWELAVRFARRHPLPTTAVLVTAMAVVAAFIGINDARLREGLARHDADERAGAARTAEKSASDALRVAERRQAVIAFDRAVLRCEVGDPTGGVADLDDAAGMADAAGDTDLAAIARSNAAAWRAGLPKLVRRLDAPAGMRPLVDAAFADQGRSVIAIGGSEGAVHIWPTDDPASPAQRIVIEGTLSGRTLYKPTPSALVPDNNGGFYTAFRPGAVRRFDPVSGKASAAVVPDPFGMIDQLVVAADGNRLAYTTADKRIRVWDASASVSVGPDLYHRPVTNDRGVLTAVSNKSPNIVTALTFADNGMFLVAAARSNGLMLWGLPSGKLLHQFDVGADVFRLAVGGGGQYILAGGETATSLWSIHNRDRPLWVHQHPQRAAALAFSPDGRTCATADHSGNVACLDWMTGQVLARLRLDESIRALAFHPSDRLLLVGGESGATELWQLPEPDVVVLASPVPTTDRPWSVVPIGAESRRTITAVGVWPGGDVWTLSPAGLDRWAGGQVNGREKRRLIPPTSGARGLRTAAVHPDGTLAITAGWESARTGVWDLSGASPKFVQLANASTPFAVGFVADSRTFYTLAGVDDLTGRLRLWEWVGDKARPAANDWAAALDVRAVAPDPSGKWLLVGSTPAQPTGLRDLETGTLLRELPHPTTVTTVDIHTSGTLAVTGGRDGSVRVWDLTEGRQVGRTFYHADRVAQVAFGTGALDGTVVTVSHDRSARVWHARTGLPLGPSLYHPEAVLAVAPADGYFLTGGKDGVLRQWRPRIGLIPRQ